MNTIILILGLLLIVALIILLAAAYKSKKILEERLTDELKGLATQVEENEKEIARKNSNILSMTKQINDFLTAVSILEFEKEHYIEQLNERNESICKLKKSNEQLESKLAEKNAQNNEFINEIKMLNEVIIERDAEIYTLKKKLARPKGKKLIPVEENICEKCAECECDVKESAITSQLEEPQQATEEETTEPIPAENSKEVIEEFYKFLKSKGKKLPKKFNMLCEKERGNVEAFLKRTDINSFVSLAFDWEKDASTKWLDISVEWASYAFDHKLI